MLGFSLKDIDFDEVLEKAKLENGRIVVYYRSNRKEGLNRQEEIIKKALGDKVVDVVYEDLGANEENGYKKLELLISELKKGDTLIVSEISRISRDNNNILDILLELKNKEVNFICEDEERMKTLDKVIDRDMHEQVYKMRDYLNEASKYPNFEDSPRYEEFKDIHNYFEKRKRSSIAKRGAWTKKRKKMLASSNG